MLHKNFPPYLYYFYFSEVETVEVPLPFTRTWLISSSTYPLASSLATWWNGSEGIATPRTSSRIDLRLDCGCFVGMSSSGGSNLASFPIADIFKSFSWLDVFRGSFGDLLTWISSRNWPAHFGSSMGATLVLASSLRLLVLCLVFEVIAASPAWDPLILKGLGY